LRESAKGTKESEGNDHPKALVHIKLYALSNNCLYSVLDLFSGNKLGYLRKIDKNDMKFDYLYYD
jgi:hypothetical protein